MLTFDWISSTCDEGRSIDGVGRGRFLGGGDNPCIKVSLRVVLDDEMPGLIAYIQQTKTAYIFVNAGV